MNSGSGNKNFEVSPQNSAQFGLKIINDNESFHLKEESDDVILEKIYDYFGRNTEKFQQEIELKNIIVEDEIYLYIKKHAIQEYLKAIMNTNNLENKKIEDETNQINNMTNSTLINTLQSLVDEGELLHAFNIYLAIRNKISIPDKQVKLWSHSYIELLRANHLHKLANEIVKYSSIIEIKNTNKVNYYFEFYEFDLEINNVISFVRKM